MLVNFDPAIVSMLEEKRLPHAQGWRPAAVASLSPSALEAQLEGHWKGCNSLTAPRRRGFVQLVAHYREVEPQRSRLNYLLGNRSLDSEAVAMIEELAACHAFTATVTIALIEKAKTRNGVLPSTEFYWAKKEDPAFWLMINGFGRPRHVAGIAGAFAHFAFEQHNGWSEKAHFDDCEIN